jgi:serine phosphatase RsbU (regulator of sigma subunit)
MRRLHGLGRAAHAQFVAVEVERDRNQTFERDQITVEVTAEIQMVAESREFEDLLRRPVSQGARLSAFAP